MDEENTPIKILQINEENTSTKKKKKIPKSAKGQKDTSKTSYQQEEECEGKMRRYIIDVNCSKTPKHIEHKNIVRPKAPKHTGHKNIVRPKALR